MKNRFMNVLNGEDGMGTLEYGIIHTNLSNQFDNVSSPLKN